jgi:hypothetical protein
MEENPRKEHELTEDRLVRLKKLQGILEQLKGGISVQNY